MAFASKDHLTLPATIRHSTLLNHGWSEADIMEYINPPGFLDGIPTSSPLAQIKAIIKAHPELEVAMIKAAWPKGFPSRPRYALFKVHYLQWALSAGRPLANGELHHIVPHKHKAKRYVVTTKNIPSLDNHYKKVEVLGIAPSSAFPVYDPQADAHGLMFPHAEPIYTVFASARNTINHHQCLKIGRSAGNHYRLIGQVIVPDSYRAPAHLTNHRWGDRPRVPLQSL